MLTKAFKYCYKQILEQSASDSRANKTLQVSQRGDLKKKKKKEIA